MFKNIELQPIPQQEKWQLAENLSKVFIQRLDLYARQLDDGRYVCVYRRFSAGLMFSHLQGDMTLGAYLLDGNNQARFTVLDADDEQGFDHLKVIAGDLAKHDIPSYLEASRRGAHLWFFFEESVPGSLARGFGRALEKEYRLDLEVYPKQEAHGQGPGSLIRVPFGIHRKTGMVYGFPQLGGLREQIETLTNPQKIPVAIVETYQYHEPKHEYHTPEGLKSIPLAEFINKYVELRPVASGFIGQCPFHDDNVPSFGINVEGNYWHCFAGCGGGDIVSFWMRYKGIDYRQAFEELNGLK